MNRKRHTADDSPSDPADSISRPVRIFGAVVTITVFVVGTAAALVYATEIFLILFLAVLFAVFLTNASQIFSDKFNVGYLWCLTAVVTLLLILSAGGIALFGAQIDQQVSGVEERLEEAQKKLQELTQQYPSVRSVISSTPFVRKLVSHPSAGTHPSADSEPSRHRGADEPAGGTNARSKSQEASSTERGAVSRVAKTAATAVASVFQTAFGLVVNSVLIFFVGLFVAVDPAGYRDGVVLLVPRSHRERTREVLDLMGDSLWRWLIGRFGSMLITGTGAGLLLMLLGVPMALTVGVATALLTFIPNIGSVIALTLALLLALPEGTGTAQWVLVGYVVLQLVESYLVTPLIQQKQVSLPPALLISCQAVMGVLFGFLGAAVASPMLAAVKVGVEEVYVKDVLDDRE